MNLAQLTPFAVIGAFPKCTIQFPKVVDYENLHLNVPYLSVAENVLRYLAHHKAISPEDALSGEKNIEDVVSSIYAFVRFPSWRGKRSRLQYVLWELHDSGILPSLLMLREDVFTKDLVPAKLVRAFRDLLTLIDRDLLSDSWTREFWRDKFYSVEGALCLLEDTFESKDLAAPDNDHDVSCQYCCDHDEMPVINLQHPEQAALADSEDTAGLFFESKKSATSSNPPPLIGQ